MAYSFRQLEQLWLSAGGSPRVAPLMAAIAMAESGGNPKAFNPSGASGLWQILGAVKSSDQSRLFDPSVNAREAVLKYNTQGLGAWTTYTSGAYKKFMHSGTLPNVVTGAELLKEAEKFKGTPYVWGGESPKGFDCSGLVQYSLEKLGLKNVPRTSEAQWAWVHHITRSELKPGDLVFFAGSDGTNTNPGHVAIYAGHNQIYQALETGTNVGLFPMSSAGTPSGFGRVPGVFGSGSGTFSGGGGGGGAAAQNITLTDVPGWASEIPFVGPALQIISNVGSLTGLPGVFGTFTNNLARIEHGIEWFFVPNHWLRIFAGIAGTGLVLAGILTMTRTGRGYSVSNPIPVYNQAAPSIPAPGGELAPAIGIAEVTIGAILLFVAFHNLEAQIAPPPPGGSWFGSLLSYYQQQIQTGGQAA